MNGGGRMNQDIRAYAKQKNVKHWQIADPEEELKRLEEFRKA